MKILKAIFGFAAVAAVLIFGCSRLYDGSAEASAGADISAEEFSEVLYTEASTEAVTEPSADKEISLSMGKTVSFTFLGDCLLSTNAGDVRPDTFEKYAQNNPSSYFFEKAVPFYSGSDFVIANNEFVLTDRNLPKAAKNGRAFWFKSPSSYTSIIKSGGIDIVSVANNHTGDYGDKGYKDTQSALESAGIKWGDLQNPVYIEKNGVRFGLICTGLFNVNYDQLVVPVIEDVKTKSDIQILFFHGGTENEHKPDDWLVELCHKYADMGVDLIVGAHPHVLRPMEEYNGVDIIYSLGNFCYGGNRLPENRTVILTETFSFDENGNYISQDEEFAPFYVYGGSHNNWQPVPVTDPIGISKTLAFMYGASELPY